ncbi:MAG: hypothetical protein [Bacteriophage sp.]|nr:MAG: hypothetical protein [Bacteriophage sp.]
MDMMKKKKTLNQLEYEKALKNLKRRIKAAEKRGFRFDKSEILPSEKPKRITKKRIESIKKLNIYSQKGTSYLDDESGKLVTGKEGRTLERKARAKKAVQTRKARKARKEQNPPTHDTIPIYSAIESVENRLNVIIEETNWQYLHYRSIGGENSAIKLKEIFERTKQAYANALALADFEKYLEKNADVINNALDVVMYASKQDELQDYTSSYSKLALIFNGGEIPSQQDMIGVD